MAGFTGGNNWAFILFLILILLFFGIGVMVLGI